MPTVESYAYCRVEGLGARSPALRTLLALCRSGFRVQDGAELDNCGVSGFGLRASGFGFRVSGFGLRVSGFGF